jgi:hypothetical protein
MLQLGYLMPCLRQKSLAGYNHLPLQQPTLSATVSPWLCFYLFTMYPFLACSCSPARPVIGSPQLVLTAPFLLLTLIASLVMGTFPVHVEFYAK